MKDQDQFSSAARPAPAPAGPAGAHMDRVVPRPRWLRWRWPAAGVLLVAGLALIAGHAPAPGSTQTVVADRLTVAAVARGEFIDDLPVRATVQPLNSVYLDAVEGGRVERVLVEDGAIVTAGTMLAELANASLQLDVLSRETQVAEQMSALRSQELNLERSRLDARLRVAELDLRHKQLGDTVEQQRALADRGFISPATLQRSEAEFSSVGRTLELARENERLTDTLQAAQLAQLRASAKQLESHLELARSHLRSLQVRAPMNGQLTAFALEVGQSVARGARIGQVDSPAEFKLIGAIDQFYLPRLRASLEGYVEAAGRRWPLRVTKVYPQVQNGEFRADLVFGAGAPPSLARGQNVNARVSLGASTSALLLPAGPFLQDNGGTFVFVLDAAGTTAERRSVRLGRRNAQHVEVLEGLAADDRVVTSSYATYTERRVLRIVSGGG